MVELAYPVKKVPALQRKWLYKMEALATLFAVLSITAVVVAILAKAIKITMSSAWYKKRFAKEQNSWAELTELVFAPVKRKLFAELDEHLKRLKGDVLEIGIGSGQNFLDYPQGTSLIAVDANPHVDKLLKKNLEKAGDRILLKKFVVASAEDMSCRGKVGVEDNSVAAVVCTKLLCSLTDEQIRKTVQEVKRVLIPGGRFFFMEHVAGKPWTLQYILQQLVSKSLLWPTLYNGCRCDRETLSWIEQGGFTMVQAEKTWVNWAPEMCVGSKRVFLDWYTRFDLCFVSSMLVGFSEKGCIKENIH